MNYLRLAIIAGAIAAVVALIGGYGHTRYVKGVSVTTARYETALTKQKNDAAALLASETEKVRVARADLEKLTLKIEKDRDDAQSKNAADLRKRQSGPRLQYTATSGDCRPAAEAGTVGAAKDAGSATVQLPEPLNGNLLQYAADAQSLAIDYGVLWNYVHNPKLVCELRP